MISITFREKALELRRIKGSQPTQQSSTVDYVTQDELASMELVVTEEFPMEEEEVRLTISDDDLNSALHEHVPEDQMLDEDDIFGTGHIIEDARDKEMDEVPPAESEGVKEKTAEEIYNEAPPFKTAPIYDRAWKYFMEFREGRDNTDAEPGEDIYVRYFHHLKNDKKYASSSIWTIFSRLNNNHQVSNISNILKEQLSIFRGVSLLTPILTFTG